MEVGSLRRQPHDLIALKLCVMLVGMDLTGTESAAEKKSK